MQTPSHRIMRRCFSMSEKNVSFPFQVLKAVLFSLAFALVSTFLFALLLRFTPVPDGAVKPVVAILKTLCAALGSLLFIKGEKGLLKGALAGGFSIVATRLLFSVFCGSFVGGLFILLDILIGVVAGGVCGVIAVNLKSR